MSHARSTESFRFDPVIVTGSGGSGTRVLATVLRDCGVFIGRDLNRALDDQAFTLLFKHPRKYAGGDERRCGGRLPPLLHLHRRLVLGSRPQGTSEWARWLSAGWSHATHRYDFVWLLRRWQALREPGPTHVEHWGWKHPQARFFLPGLSEFYPSARLVLLLRSGLDMVYTKDDQEFTHWAPCFGIDPRDRRPGNIFAFWHRSNLHALELGRRRLGPRLHVVHFEQLCQEPRREVERLLTFVGVGEDAVPPHVWEHPQPPPSIGRYRRHDTSWIDERVRQQMAELGFEIEVHSSASR